MRKKRILVLLAIALLSYAAAGFAQVWEKKGYTKWSKSDCQKLLRDSPWASSYTIGTVLLQPVSEESAVPGRESNPQITYAAQFWSAKPVREAIIRLQQLDSKYEKLSEDEKAVFDQKAGQFLNAEFPEQIVIQVSYSGSQAFMLPLLRFWKQKTHDDLRQTITLIAEGKRLAPVQVVVAGGGGNELQVIFPRMVDGQPVVNPDMKELRLEILDPVETVSIPFPVKKMRMGGQLVF